MDGTEAGRAGSPPIVFESSSPPTFVRLRNAVDLKEKLSLLRAIEFEQHQTLPSSQYELRSDHRDMHTALRCKDRTKVTVSIPSEVVLEVLPPPREIIVCPRRVLRNKGF
jgi:hypothetical protein